VFFTLENVNIISKQLGAIFIVAGTAIGGGIIALPVMIAKLGILLGIVLMFVIWVVVYYTAIVNVELNLQAGKGLPLGQLGALFSGKVASLIGIGTLKLLMFSLMSVYIYGLASLFREGFNWDKEYFSVIAGGVSLCVMLALLCPIHFLDYLNRVLFVGALIVAGILTLALSCGINGQRVPFLVGKYKEFSSWSIVVPVVFTSFGFQVVFHTLSNYCAMDKKVLHKVFFWGSLIPAIVYIIWSCVILCVIYNYDPDFYALMVDGKVDVSELVRVLSLVSGLKVIQVMVWVISFLTMATSVLGVGMGLCDSIESHIKTKFKHSKWISVIVAVGFPAIIAIFVPGAFIAILGFAGMILSVLAILLPIYILLVGRFKKAYYASTTNKFMLMGSVIIGIAIILCEVINIIS
jgi:tyrosine-specific transport protein